MNTLFKKYPLREAATISVGDVPTPYHIYDGYGLFIGGTADLHSVKRLLQSETVIPMQTADGRAVMGIWVCNFLQASLDPHHELQCSVFVARGTTSPISAHPVGLLSAMLTRSDMQMMCHGLWNNTPKVVAYNRELLSLNARLTDSRIDLKDNTLTFTFAESGTGTPLLDGSITISKRTSPPITRALMQQMGVMRSLRIAMQPTVHMEVINPLGVSLTRNATADAYTRTDVNIIREFDVAADRLTLEALPYKDLGFEPRIMQFMNGFKFVYQNPR